MNTKTKASSGKTTKEQGSKPTRAARTLYESMRQFLTPNAWGQANQARKEGRTPRSKRWHTEPLVFVLLVFTWCAGDSSAERFEAARAFYVHCHSRRLRPGKTVDGFQKALGLLPMSTLRRLAELVRNTLTRLLAERLVVDGWLAFGVDGSRLECPRTPELERGLGCAGKKHSAPTVWVTACVHLGTGLLWSWWLGRGNASERDHARCLLGTLPAKALLVADAGFNGYHLCRDIIGQGKFFLIRMSAKVTLLVDKMPSRRVDDSRVVYWPEKDREAGGPPIETRLLRVRDQNKRKDVWLLTNVLDGERLPLELAARFYRQRWENEGLFRTYKRTLKNVKLLSRTVRLVHREAEASLLGAQLLLAQGTLAMPPRKTAPASATSVQERCSPRKVLLEIRQEIKDLAGKRKRSFGKRLSAACREERVRQTAKEARTWPRRKPHRPPKPPKLRERTKHENWLLQQLPTPAAA